MLSYKKEEFFGIHKEKINKRGDHHKTLCERQCTCFLPNFWHPSLIRTRVSFLHKSFSLWAQLSGHIFILFFGHLSFKIWSKRWTPASLPSCGHPQSLLFFPHSQSPSMTLSHHHGPLPHYSRYILLRYEGIQRSHCQEWGKPPSLVGSPLSTTTHRYKNPCKISLSLSHLIS